MKKRKPKFDLDKLARPAKTKRTKVSFWEGEYKAGGLCDLQHGRWANVSELKNIPEPSNPITYKRVKDDMDEKSNVLSAKKKKKVGKTLLLDRNTNTIECIKRQLGEWNFYFSSEERDLATHQWKEMVEKEFNKKQVIDPLEFNHLIVQSYVSKIMSEDDKDVEVQISMDRPEPKIQISNEAIMKWRTETMGNKCISERASKRRGYLETTGLFKWQVNYFLKKKEKLKPNHFLLYPVEKNDTSPRFLKALLQREKLEQMDERKTLVETFQQLDMASSEEYPAATKTLLRIHLLLKAKFDFERKKFLIAHPEMELIFDTIMERNKLDAFHLCFQNNMECLYSPIPMQIIFRDLPSEIFEVLHWLTVGRLTFVYKGRVIYHNDTFTSNFVSQIKGEIDDVTDDSRYILHFIDVLETVFNKTEQIQRRIVFMSKRFSNSKFFKKLNEDANIYFKELIRPHLQIEEKKDETGNSQPLSARTSKASRRPKEIKTRLVTDMTSFKSNSYEFRKLVFVPSKSRADTKVDEKSTSQIDFVLHSYLSNNRWQTTTDNPKTVRFEENRTVIPFPDVYLNHDCSYCNLIVENEILLGRLKKKIGMNPIQLRTTQWEAEHADRKERQCQSFAITKNRLAISTKDSVENLLKKYELIQETSKMSSNLVEKASNITLSQRYYSTLNLPFSYIAPQLSQYELAIEPENQPYLQMFGTVYPEAWILISKKLMFTINGTIKVLMVNKKWEEIDDITTYQMKTRLMRAIKTQLVKILDEHIDQMFLDTFKNFLTPEQDDSGLEFLRNTLYLYIWRRLNGFLFGVNDVKYREMFKSIEDSIVSPFMRSGSSSRSIDSAIQVNMKVTNKIIEYFNNIFEDNTITITADDYDKLFQMAYHAKATAQSMEDIQLSRQLRRKLNKCQVFPFDWQNREASVFATSISEFTEAFLRQFQDGSNVDFSQFQSLLDFQGNLPKDVLKAQMLETDYTFTEIIFEKYGKASSLSSDEDAVLQPVETEKFDSEDQQAKIARSSSLSSEVKPSLSTVTVSVTKVVEDPDMLRASTKPLVDLDEIDITTYGRYKEMLNKIHDFQKNRPSHALSIQEGGYSELSLNFDDTNDIFYVGQYDKFVNSEGQIIKFDENDMPSILQTIRMIFDQIEKDGDVNEDLVLEKIFRFFGVKRKLVNKIFERKLTNRNFEKPDDQLDIDAINNLVQDIICVKMLQESPSTNTITRKALAQALNGGKPTFVFSAMGKLFSLDDNQIKTEVLDFNDILKIVENLFCMNGVMNHNSVTKLKKQITEAIMKSLESWSEVEDPATASVMKDVADRLAHILIEESGTVKKTSKISLNYRKLILRLLHIISKLPSNTRSEEPLQDLVGMAVHEVNEYVRRFSVIKAGLPRETNAICDKLSTSTKNLLRIIDNITNNSEQILVIDKVHQSNTQYTFVDKVDKIISEFLGGSEQKIEDSNTRLNALTDAVKQISELNPPKMFKNLQLATGVLNDLQQMKKEFRTILGRLDTNTYASITHDSGRLQKKALTFGTATSINFIHTMEKQSHILIVDCLMKAFFYVSAVAQLSVNSAPSVILSYCAVLEKEITKIVKIVETINVEKYRMKEWTMALHNFHSRCRTLLSLTGSIANMIKINGFKPLRDALISLQSFILTMFKTFIKEDDLTVLLKNEDIETLTIILFSYIRQLSDNLNDEQDKSKTIETCRYISSFINHVNFRKKLKMAMNLPGIQSLMKILESFPVIRNPEDLAKIEEFCNLISGNIDLVTSHYILRTTRKDLDTRLFDQNNTVSVVMELLVAMQQRLVVQYQHLLSKPPEITIESIYRTNGEIITMIGDKRFRTAVEAAKFHDILQYLTKYVGTCEEIFTNIQLLITTYKEGRKHYNRLMRKNKDIFKDADYNESTIFNLNTRILLLFDNWLKGSGLGKVIIKKSIKEIQSIYNTYNVYLPYWQKKNSLKIIVPLLIMTMDEFQIIHDDVTFSNAISIQLDSSISILNNVFNMVSLMMQYMFTPVVDKNKIDIKTVTQIQLFLLNLQHVSETYDEEEMEYDQITNCLNSIMPLLKWIFTGGSSSVTGNEGRLFSAIVDLRNYFLSNFEQGSRSISSILGKKIKSTFKITFQCLKELEMKSYETNFALPENHSQLVLSEIAKLYLILQHFDGLPPTEFELYLHRLTSNIKPLVRQLKRYRTKILALPYRSIWHNYFDDFINTLTTYFKLLSESKNSFNVVTNETSVIVQGSIQVISEIVNEKLNYPLPQLRSLDFKSLFTKNFFIFQVYAIQLYTLLLNQIVNVRPIGDSIRQMIEDCTLFNENFLDKILERYATEDKVKTYLILVQKWELVLKDTNQLLTESSPLELLRTISKECLDLLNEFPFVLEDILAIERPPLVGKETISAIKMNNIIIKGLLLLDDVSGLLRNRLPEYWVKEYKVIAPKYDAYSRELDDTKEFPVMNKDEYQLLFNIFTDLTDKVQEMSSLDLIRSNQVRDQINNNYITIFENYEVIIYSYHKKSLSKTEEFILNSNLIKFLANISLLLMKILNLDKPNAKLTECNWIYFLLSDIYHRISNKHLQNNLVQYAWKYEFCTFHFKLQETVEALRAIGQSEEEENIEDLIQIARHTLDAISKLTNKLLEETAKVYLEPQTTQILDVLVGNLMIKLAMVHVNWKYESKNKDTNTKFVEEHDKLQLYYATIEREIDHSLKIIISDMFNDSIPNRLRKLEIIDKSKRDFLCGQIFQQIIAVLTNLQNRPLVPYEPGLGNGYDNTSTLLIIAKDFQKLIKEFCGGDLKAGKAEYVLQVNELRSKTSQLQKMYNTVFGLEEWTPPIEYRDLYNNDLKKEIFSHIQKLNNKINRESQDRILNNLLEKQQQLLRSLTEPYFNAIEYPPILELKDLIDVTLKKNKEVENEIIVSYQDNKRIGKNIYTIVKRAAMKFEKEMEKTFSLPRSFFGSATELTLAIEPTLRTVIMPFQLMQPHQKEDISEIKLDKLKSVFAMVVKTQLENDFLSRLTRQRPNLFMDKSLVGISSTPSTDQLREMHEDVAVSLRYLINNAGKFKEMVTSKKYDKLKKHVSAMSATADQVIDVDGTEPNEIDILRALVKDDTLYTEDGKKISEIFDSEKKIIKKVFDEKGKLQTKIFDKDGKPIEKLFSEDGSEVSSVFDDGKVLKDLYDKDKNKIDEVYDKDKRKYASVISETDNAEMILYDIHGNQLKQVFDIDGNFKESFVDLTQDLYDVEGKKLVPIYTEVGKLTDNLFDMYGHQIRELYDIEGNVLSSLTTEEHEPVGQVFHSDGTQVLELLNKEGTEIRPVYVAYRSVRTELTDAKQNQISSYFDEEGNEIKQFYDSHHRPLPITFDSNGDPIVDRTGDIHLYPDSPSDVHYSMEYQMEDQYENGSDLPSNFSFKRLQAETSRILDIPSVTISKQRIFKDIDDMTVKTADTKGDIEKKMAKSRIDSTRKQMYKEPFLTEKSVTDDRHRKGSVLSVKEEAARKREEVAKKREEVVKKREEAAKKREEKYLKGKYVEGHYIDGKYVDGIIVDDEFIEGKYIDGKFVEGTYIDGKFVERSSYDDDDGRDLFEDEMSTMDLSEKLSGKIGKGEILTKEQEKLLQEKKKAEKLKVPGEIPKRVRQRKPGETEDGDIDERTEEEIQEDLEDGNIIPDSADLEEFEDFTPEEEDKSIDDSVGEKKEKKLKGKTLVMKSSKIYRGKPKTLKIDEARMESYRFRAGNLMLELRSVGKAKMYDEKDREMLVLVDRRGRVLTDLRSIDSDVRSELRSHYNKLYDENDNVLLPVILQKKSSTTLFVDVFGKTVEPVKLISNDGKMIYADEIKENALFGRKLNITYSSSRDVEFDLEPQKSFAMSYDQRGHLKIDFDDDDETRAFDDQGREMILITDKNGKQLVNLKSVQDNLKDEIKQSFMNLSHGRSNEMVPVIGRMVQNEKKFFDLDQVEVFPEPPETNEDKLMSPETRMRKARLGISFDEETISPSAGLAPHPPFPKKKYKYRSDDFFTVKDEEEDDKLNMDANEFSRRYSTHTNKPIRKLIKVVDKTSLDSDEGSIKKALSKFRESTKIAKIVTSSFDQSAALTEEGNLVPPFEKPQSVTEQQSLSVMARRRSKKPLSLDSSDESLHGVAFLQRVNFSRIGTKNLINQVPLLSPEYYESPDYQTVPAGQITREIIGVDGLSAFQAIRKDSALDFLDADHSCRRRNARIQTFIPDNNHLHYIRCLLENYETSDKKKDKKRPTHESDKPAPPSR
ncbi:hypothetical protein SNEBB_007932 [Seison nebaliae]|nr:hypothetical protein SNEBB_007932 [Seison nebaliae]